MQKRKHLIVGNWKMNPTSLEEVRRVISRTKKTAKDLKRTEVVVCPPYPFLHLLNIKPKDKIYAGVQDVFIQAAGSFTGEVSAEMVRSLGARYVIVGHSERRALGESDELIAKKVSAGLLAGLKVVLCVGELTRDQSGAYLEFLRKQITSSLGGSKKKFLADVIIAYEPVFAIGKSFKEAMQPRDVLETILFIKKVLTEIFGKEAVSSVAILYGGSVNFENAGPIIENGGVDGLLVGRESINTETFPKLLKAIDAVPI